MHHPRSHQPGDNVDYGRGIQFRSAKAAVLIACDWQTARYLNAAFLCQVRLSGQAFKVLRHANNDLGPVAFADIGEHVNARIIKAACNAKNVTSR